MEQGNVEQPTSVNNPQVNQSQQTSPLPVSQSLSKKPLIIGGVILGFLLFGVGEYVLGVQQTSPKGMTSNTITPTPSPISTSIPSQSSPTTSPTSTNRKYGPESLWFRTEGKAKQFLSSKLITTPPTGWVKIDCGDSYNYNPSGGVDSCATEPNAFAINVYPDSPYIQEVNLNSEEKIISNQKEITIAGKKAIQFDKEVVEGQAQGKYKETVIMYSEDTYLYIVLNKLSEESSYSSS